MTEEQLMDEYYYHCDATYTEAPNQENPIPNKPKRLYVKIYE